MLTELYHLGGETDKSPSSLTDMQNKYCVDCYNIYSIQNNYNGNHLCNGFE